MKNKKEERKKSNHNILENNPAQEFDVSLKYLVVGNEGVGKTRIVDRFTRGEYVENHLSKLEFSIKTINIDDKLVKMQIWDKVTGKEKVSSSANATHYRSAQVIIIVFDLTDIRTFENAKMWLREVTSYAPINPETHKRDVAIVLVGAKSDLNDTRTVDYQIAKEYADLHTLYYFECSAKHAHNIDEVFLVPTRDILSRLPTTQSNNNNNNNSDDEKKCVIS